MNKCILAAREGRVAACGLFAVLVLGIAAVAVAARASAQTLPASTRPASTRQWELLSFGSGDHLWYAVTTPADSAESEPRTFVFDRALQEEWGKLTDFPGRLTAMGELRGQLVASLDDGEWKRISADQFASGPPLPGRSEILALAGQDGVLWAVGFGDASGAPATRSGTTQPARPAITTAPAAATRPEGLQLYKLVGTTWQRVAALPPEARTARGQEISLVLCKGTPTVAYKAEREVARVDRYDAQQDRWMPMGAIRCAFAIRKLKLLTARDQLVGWATGEIGVGAFFFPPSDSQGAAADAAWRRQPLSVPDQVRVSDVSAAAAGAELRLLVIDAMENPYEQKYELNGLESSKLAKLPSPKGPNETTLGDMISWGVIAVLMVVTLATANKGGPVRIASVNNIELALAPFALRLAAGLIDLWPSYVGELLIVHHFNKGVRLSQVYTDRFSQWVVVVTLAVYFLHTVVGELAWGRTMGKMFVGLRVVGLDGKRPPMSAIFLRNCMRVVEVLLAFPLLVIFFSPLRQRVGDFTSATVVVAKRPAGATLKVAEPSE